LVGRAGGLALRVPPGCMISELDARPSWLCGAIVLWQVRPHRGPAGQLRLARGWLLLPARACLR
jgi:hypothetical protein